jgi:hypothetical protein
MTADEIRKMRDDTVSGRIDGSLTEESASVFFLAEIAAQLAELNDQGSISIKKEIRIADAELVDAGNAMADHYRDLVTSLFSRTAETAAVVSKEIPPSITRWEKLTKKFVSR